jgi:hypothetical protein
MTTLAEARARDLELRHRALERCEKELAAGPPARVVDVFGPRCLMARDVVQALQASGDDMLRSFVDGEMPWSVAVTMARVTVEETADRVLAMRQGR